MPKWLIHWLIGMLSVTITVFLAKILNINLSWDKTWHVIIFVPVFAMLNTVLGTLLKIVSLPLTCITFGLYGIIINAIVFYLAGILTGGSMNFWGALFGSVSVSIINIPLSWILKGGKKLG
ncbi:MAG: phage holin family protein [Armatimonadota bacterium]